jgi:hypothetical protein
MFDKSTLFMQNKPNFENDKMNINALLTMRYANLNTWRGCKNKPNSKPIKPITNPIKAKTKPIQTQFKPNQSQFLERRNNADTSYGPQHKKGQAAETACRIITKWAGVDLNHRHTDFQSVAVKIQILTKQRLVKPRKSS